MIERRHEEILGVVHSSSGSRLDTGSGSRLDSGSLVQVLTVLGLILVSGFRLEVWLISKGRKNVSYKLD